MRSQVVRNRRLRAEAIRIDDGFRKRARVVLVTIALLLLARLPMYTAWWVSRPWMDQIAREFEQTPVNSQVAVSRWAGLYQVTMEQDCLHGFQLHLSPGVGYGRVTYGKPHKGIDMPAIRPVEPLGGGWYTSP